MTEVVEASDFVARTILPVIQIIAKLVRSLEINQLQSEFCANRIDHAEDVFLLLRLSPFISGAIKQPGNFGGGTILISKLLDSQTTRADEVKPPVIVRLDLIFFPRHEGDSAGGHNVLTSILPGCQRCQSDRREYQHCVPKHGKELARLSAFRNGGKVWMFRREKSVADGRNESSPVSGSCLAAARVRQLKGLGFAR